MTTALVAPTYFKAAVADGKVAFARFQEPYLWPFIVGMTESHFVQIPFHHIERMPKTEWERLRPKNNHA
jgi:hypothetical protein